MSVAFSPRRATLYSATLAAAITAQGQTPVIVGPGCKYLALFARFVRIGGGTTVDVWIQTSIDGGVTWFDIANFHFVTTTLNLMLTAVIEPATPLASTTPGSGALSANTVLNGIIGDRVRALVTTVGTYTGASLIAVDMVAKG